MRKTQRTQAEKLVKLLGKAHDEIRTAMETKNIPTALSLLEQCQQGAIRLGELIEENEGEGFITISMLEDYCEQIYEVHEEIVTERLADTDKACRDLGESLLQIENSILNDIKLNYEVVFLPYKASMWDSLESVWKAANEDPNCKVYVIPIPFFYKNPDGSYREMNYEGNQYPCYVPITRYDEFDFEQHRPDMIFIHNPYDEYNHAVSVHPFFFSSNLKKYTNNLIYIPYFILDEIDPCDSRAVESMEHFVWMPGVVNADKVIVQSPNLRQAYIDFLSKNAGANTREIWEKKILGMGSPKMDKMHNVRKEDIEVPEKWLRIIRKPDGSWRKIILYHTSVSTLFQYNMQMLIKIQGVFKRFWESRKEIALLWYPHPLIKTSVVSSCPQLWAQYQKIEKQYKAEEWGIYVDSSDIGKAVLLSDAYYGDAGSVAQLCRIANKAIMIQSV